MRVLNIEVPKSCGLCGELDVIELEYKVHTFEGRGEHLWYYFQCRYCGENYTTTELDEENLKHLKEK